MNPLGSLTKSLHEATHQHIRDIDFVWRVYEIFTPEIDLLKGLDIEQSRAIGDGISLWDPSQASQALFRCRHALVNQFILQFLTLKWIMAKEHQALQEQRSSLSEKSITFLTEYLSRNTITQCDLDILVAAIVVNIFISKFAREADIIGLLPCLRNLDDNKKDLVLLIWKSGISFSLERLFLGESTSANLAVLEGFRSYPLAGRIFLFQQVLALQDWSVVASSSITDVLLYLENLISGQLSPNLAYARCLEAVVDYPPSDNCYSLCREDSRTFLLRIYLLSKVTNQYKATCINRVLNTLSIDEHEDLARAFQFEVKKEGVPCVEWRHANATLQQIFRCGGSTDEVQPMLEALFKFISRMHQQHIQLNIPVMGNHLSPVTQDLLFVVSTLKSHSNYQSIVRTLNELSTPSSGEFKVRESLPEIEDAQAGINRASPIGYFLDKVGVQITERNIQNNLTILLATAPAIKHDKEQERAHLEALRHIINHIRSKKIIIYNFHHRPSSPFIGVNFLEYATQHQQSNFVGTSAPKFLAGTPVLSGIAGTLRHLYMCITSPSYTTLLDFAPVKLDDGDHGFVTRRVKHFDIMDVTPLTDPGVPSKFSLKVRPAIARIRLRKYQLSPLEDQIAAMIAGLRLCMLESKVLVRIWIPDADDSTGDTAGVLAYTIVDSQFVTHGLSFCVVRESLNGTLMLAVHKSNGDEEKASGTAMPLSYLTTHFITAGSMLLTTDKEVEDRLYVNFFENPNIESDINGWAGDTRSSLRLEYES